MPAPVSGIWTAQKWYAVQTVTFLWHSSSKTYCRVWQSACLQRKYEKYCHMTSSCGATVIIFLSGFLQGIRQTIDRWFFRHLKSDLFLLDCTESSGSAAPLNPGRNPSLYWLSFETREGNHFWWLCSLPVINLWFWCWMLLMTKQKLMLKIHQLLALTCGVESTTGNNSSA